MGLLLTRDVFRNSVFERDGHKCVVCGDTESPLDAHHIMERRLFPDGGYYIDNGATLCDKGVEGCHYKAETTEISVEHLMDLCGISCRVTPPDLYPDHVYDKWGNSILSNGQRTIGPLFHVETVQKVLSKSLHLFTDYVKYPRTYHLPWSAGITSDDKVLPDTRNFDRRRVVVTRKMDGENTSLYPDGKIHARSVDGRSRETQDWVKSYWSHRSYDLPPGWRVVGENLFAKHSIKYDNLKSYFLGFGIYDDFNVCLPWDQTLIWFGLLDIQPVETLYCGMFDETLIRSLYDESRDYDQHEGYVVRNVDPFPYGAFSSNVAKYVRRDHIRTTRHWSREKTVQNVLTGGGDMIRMVR